MDLGAVTLDETAAREWLTREIQQGPAGLFGVLDWSPLEIGTESQVIELIDSAQRRQVLTGPAEFVSRIGLIYTDDPAGYNACRRWETKRRRADEEAAQSSALRWYGAGSHVTIDQLIPGRVGVRRYTEPSRGRTLQTWVPCCGRPLRLAPDDRDDPERRAVCCRCSVIYRVVLIDEEDGGYGAAFIVERCDAAITLHTSPRQQRL